jgi:hypothetical protein
MGEVFGGSVGTEMILVTSHLGEGKEEASFFLDGDWISDSVRYHNCRSDPTFMVPKKNFVSFFSLVS